MAGICRPAWPNGVPEPRPIVLIPVRTVLPSGLNATDKTYGSNRLNDRTASCCVPEAPSLCPRWLRKICRRGCTRPDKALRAPWADQWATRLRHPRAAQPYRRTRSNTVLPSELNATEVTYCGDCRCLHGLTDRLSGGYIPESRRLVLASGENPLAVGAERHFFTGPA